MTGNILQRAKQLLSSFVADELCSDKEPDISIRAADGFEMSQHRSRDACLKRVRTFSTLTWFCKPAQLSPLVCARYGWENQQTELLKCITCSALLSGHFPDSSCARSSGVYVQKLEDGLISGHKSTCPWRSNPTPWWCVYLPVHMPNTLHEMIVDQYEELLQLMMHDRLTTGHLPLPIIASDTLVQEAVIELPRFIETCQTVLLQSERFLDEENSSDIVSFLKSIKETALLLAITGWSHRESCSGAVLFCEYCQREAGLWNYESREDPRDNRAITDSQSHLVENMETTEVATKRNQENEFNSMSGNQDQESMDASSTESDNLSDQNRTTDSDSASVHDVHMDSDSPSLNHGNTDSDSLWCEIKSESDSSSRPSESWDIDPEVNVDFEMLIDESNRDRLQDDSDTARSGEQHAMADKINSDTARSGEQYVIAHSNTAHSGEQHAMSDKIDSDTAHSGERHVMADKVDSNTDNTDDMENGQMITEQEYSMTDESTRRTERTEPLDTIDADSPIERNHPLKDGEPKYDDDDANDDDLNKLPCVYTQISTSDTSLRVNSIDMSEHKCDGKFDNNLTTIHSPDQRSLKNTDHADSSDIKNIAALGEAVKDDLEITASPSHNNVEKSPILRQDDLEKIDSSILCNLINNVNDSAMDKEENTDIHATDDQEMNQTQDNSGKMCSPEQDKIDCHIPDILEKTDIPDLVNIEGPSISSQDNYGKTNIPCPDNSEATVSPILDNLEIIDSHAHDDLLNANFPTPHLLEKTSIICEDNLKMIGGTCEDRCKHVNIVRQDNLEKTTTQTHEGSDMLAISTQNHSENTDNSIQDSLEKTGSSIQENLENIDINSEKTAICMQVNSITVINNVEGVDNAGLTNLKSIDIYDDNNLKDAKTLTEIGCSDNIKTGGCKKQVSDIEAVKSFKDDSSSDIMMKTCASLEESVCSHNEHGQDVVSSNMTFPANSAEHSSNNGPPCEENKSALPSSESSLQHAGKRKVMVTEEDEELGTGQPHSKLAKLDAALSPYSIKKSAFDPLKEHKSWCPWLTHDKLPCQDQNLFDKYHVDAPGQMSSNGSQASPEIGNQQIETSLVEKNCQHSAIETLSEISELKQPLTPTSNASDVTLNEGYLDRTYPGWKRVLIVLNLWKPDHGLLERSPPRIMQKQQADGLRYVRRILRDWPSSANLDAT